MRGPMLHHSHKVYQTVAAAQDVADELNAEDEDGWTYKVVADPKGTGKAIIKIFDEAGEFVGNL